MKRLLALALAALMLVGCTPTAPPETSVPPIPTTTAPTVPTQTTAPPETTVPPFSSYTVKITDPEKAIYAGPSFLADWVAYFEEAGVYTIQEEAHDQDGNLWGKLKSGIGWTCLTDPPKAPIYAEYAAEGFQPVHAYWTEETEYVTEMAFTTEQTLRNVQFTLLNWDESYKVESVLYELDTITPETPFLAAVVFWGDMTTYGISFTDAQGAVRRFALTISGKDGSLVCYEY